MADTFSVSDKDKNVLAKDVPSPVTISKLTGNTVYDGWTATKNDGDSILNIPDQTTLPNKPVVTLKPGDKTVNVAVALAKGDGNAPLTKVTVSYKTQAGTDKLVPVDVEPSKMNVDINGLTDGTPYQFTAVVSNAAGDSAVSDAVTSTPQASLGVPGKPTPTPATIAVTGVTLDPNKATVDVGKTQQLTATVSPDNATDKTVTYKSSDDTIASVDGKGLVTGVKAGSVTVTASTKDGNKQATSDITVSASAAK